ncbi:MAG TPA: hypothetical protein VM513_20915 [Kofleriaceae bacterium]|jgi:hypothetical protein|nr:hypothetical protein [Kofleriaceae bacterium]
MKTTLVLKDSIVRDAKKRAAELGITLSELTERALRDALAEKPAERKRIVLPTSGHGLPIQHDLTPERIRELDNADDEDHIRRLEAEFARKRE